MYGSLLASCGYDRKVIIWHETVGRWEKLHEYAEHSSSVNCVCWAPHPYGLMLACASSDGTISILTSDGSDAWHAVRIPDAHSMSATHTIDTNHEDMIHDAQLDYYGTTLATASSDESIKIFDVRNKKQTLIAHLRDVSWSPAINADFMLNPNVLQSVNPLIKRLVSAGSDLLIKIWREETSSSGTSEWVEETRLEGHSDWVRDVAWAPSLNISRQMIASCGQDGRVIVWVSTSSTNPNAVHHGATLEPSEYAQRPGGTSWLPIVLHTYSDVVWHVSWSITGNILAVSGGDNKVTLWKETLEGNWIALSEIARNHGGPPSLMGADEPSQISNLSIPPVVST
ncbi:hypothetical protein AHF37_00252 [Paragonimus kellicotti]|nr:hypothetical protein AHF37_00252 [Paragonimus kellicotti]